MFRLALNSAAYRELCKMLDERDGGCIVCGAVSTIEHHHVIERSHGGDDRADNMVCLCHKHHEACDKGTKSRAERKKWETEFLGYLKSERCRKWESIHRGRLEALYRRVK